MSGCGGVYKDQESFATQIRLPDGGQTLRALFAFGLASGCCANISVGRTEAFESLFLPPVT